MATLTPRLLSFVAFTPGFRVNYVSQTPSRFRFMECRYDVDSDALSKSTSAHERGE